MPKFTVYVPVAHSDALQALEGMGVDKNALFVDAMLGYLAHCEDYQPPPNSLDDVVIRLRRVEEWVSQQIAKEDEEQPDKEPELSGTLHIGMGHRSLCGVGKPGRIFLPMEAERLVNEHDECNLCIACNRLYRNQEAHADGGHRVPLCGVDSLKVFDADDLPGLVEGGYPVCKKCLEMSTDKPER